MINGSSLDAEGFRVADAIALDQISSALAGRDDDRLFYWRAEWLSMTERAGFE